MKDLELVADSGDAVARIFRGAYDFDPRRDDVAFCPEAAMSFAPMVCSLRVELPDGTFRPGSGWLAGPRTIVTAGHTLFDRAAGGLAWRVMATPGPVNGDRLRTGLRAREVRVAPQWEHRHDRRFDIGCIHLDEPIGHTYGWLRYRALDKANLIARNARVAGYPWRRDRGETLACDTTAIVGADEHRLRFAAPVDSGRSGGPVVMTEAFTKVPLVVGVHDMGFDDLEPLACDGWDQAMRISPQIQNLISKWVAEAPAA